MDEQFKDPVALSKGFNLSDAMSSSGTEFHIDMDFKKKPIDTFINGDDDLYPDGEDDEDSDVEDVLKNLDKRMDNLMLNSPEHKSFEELKKDMIDVTPCGGVKIMIFEEGDGPLVPVDAEVTMHYAAYWEKTTIPFDSSLTMNCGEPVRIRLGRSRLLPGVETALTALRGPQARILALLQPRWAWGEMGVAPRVRAEPVLFVIALYDVKDTQAGVRFNDLPTEEQMKYENTIKTINPLHTEAKDLFKEKKYRRAVKKYQQSIHVINLSRPQNETQGAELIKFKIKAYTNLAVCYSKLNKPKEVIKMLENLDYVTDIEKHCKALFYFGKAYEMLGKTEEALTYYKKALKLEPKNKEIGSTLAQLDKKTRKWVENEKNMWQTALKTEAKEKSVVYDVDEDFKNSVRDMCQDLAGSQGARFDLPTGLTKDEVSCIKDLCKEFEGIVVMEDGEGHKKKVTVVKKMLN